MIKIIFLCGIKYWRKIRILQYLRERERGLIKDAYKLIET